MQIQHHIRTPKFQCSIPLLDKEFDAKSPEIADFILSHAHDHDEDFYFMGFNRQTR